MAELDAAAGVLTVDLAALCDNWRLLRSRVQPAECGAVVKANAYGLGAEAVSRALYRAGCRTFFVALVDEGLRLRPALPPDASVYVMHGPFEGAEGECVEAGLLPVLNSLHQVQRWQAVAQAAGRRLNAGVQIDTGMARMGLSDEEALQVAAMPGLLQHTDVSLLMSHLVAAECPNDPVNVQQLQRFQRWRPHWPQARASLANSSGVFLGAPYHFDLARPGAALYGVAPQPGTANPLRPVVRLQGRLIQSREIEAGSGVGYNHTWVAPRRSRIGTVSVGYADGLLRSLSGRGRLGWQGHEVPLVGRVSMDSITVDLTDLPAQALQPGTLFDLLDEVHDINAMAEQAGTNAYEILTSLGDRYRRRYVGSASLDAA
jgi:alanine racemase